MTRAGPWVLVALGVGALALLALLAQGTLALLAGLGGFWDAAWRTFYHGPWTASRAFAVATFVLVVGATLLTPLAWWESRSALAFARREQALREASPDAVVGPYEGPEGAGVAFDGPEGRLLLLHPPARVGRPVELWRPHPAPSAEPDSTVGFKPSA